MSVKVCIVGCGAIGSIFGAHLARLEEVEVYAYDVNKEHVRAIHERGLRISGAADFTVHLEATSDVSQIPACDLGIVATKSTHTRRAIEQTKHIFGLASAVCSVQNGVGNEEILAEHVRYVIRGTTYRTCSARISSLPTPFCTEHTALARPKMCFVCSIARRVCVLFVATMPRSQAGICETSEVASRCTVKSAAPLMRRPRS